jgi:hypothetical protein
MPDLFPLQLPVYPGGFTMTRQQVPSFDEIARRAQNNGGPAVVLPTFSFSQR